jgi:phosphatidylserine/phosphatidylglycerophosphate/cardiolipin synthase-like enzyme
MTDRDKYQILDVDREESPGIYHPYYPITIPAYVGQVEPLIDGASFFNDLYATIESLSGDIANQSIYLLNWTFNLNFYIQPTELFTDYLKRKAGLGIDVRVLLWVNEFFLGTADTWNLPIDVGFGYPAIYAQMEKERDVKIQGQDYWNGIMQQNLAAILDLRSDPVLAEKAQINTLDCPPGSSHAKFAVVLDQFSSTAYTGGMDYDVNRISDSNHLEDSNGWNHLNGWHDIQAKVSGEVTQAMYDYYRSLWNELVDLKNNAATSGYKVPEFLTGGIRIPGTTANAVVIPARTLPVPISGLSHYVQSLRTLPNKNFPVSKMTPPDAFDFTFAPAGAFEIQLAVRKAIANAEVYIYIEDQAMSSREILGYLRDALKSKPDLKVILVTGQSDPEVPQPIAYTVSHYFLDQLVQSEKDRVAIFALTTAYLHSKLYIIDDKFALLGSAGVYNRALFVEIEHSVSFVDINSDTQSVKQLRWDLWAEHFKLTAVEKPQIQQYSEGLPIWNPAWGTTTATFSLPRWTNDSQQFSGLTWTKDGQQIPSCLYPFKVFKVDKNGNRVAGNSTVFDKKKSQYESDPAQFIAGGTDFLRDSALPLSTEVDLTGKWIHVVAGSDNGQWFKITSHVGDMLTFGIQPSPIDATSLYRVYVAYLDKMEFVGPVAAAGGWIDTFENFDDCGELR